MKRIAIVGYQGKMGSVVFEQLKNKYELIGIGKNDLLKIASESDLIIDFSNGTNSTKTALWCAENKIPLISLNASQTVGIYEALVNEINECLPIIKEILTFPAYIEVDIEKKVRRRCIFRRYKTIVEKIAKYDILENKMIADLIHKINWFLTAVKEEKVFEIKTIKMLFENSTNYEYGLDNFRNVNRLYNGKMLKNILDVNNVPIEMQTISNVLHREAKYLLNNRFSKYLDAQNIAIENNRIIDKSSKYKKCYELYQKSCLIKRVK